MTLHGSRLLFAALLVLPAVAACGRPAGGATTGEQNAPATEIAGEVATAAGTAGKPKVVATFSILGDLARNVGGDLIDLRVLVPPGADAHTFEPTPSDSVALAEAGIIFENGLDFEAWLPDLYSAAGSRARRVVVSEGIELIEAEEGKHAAGDEHAEAGTTPPTEEDEAHGEHDPHVWNDVHNAIRMVENIRDGLAAADPANAAAYRANADAYLQQLKQLDAFVVEQVGTLPRERRKLVTTHDTLGYFARRYGFEIVGTALGSLSTEVADPSAAAIAKLADEVKATGVPAIFADNVSGEGVTERLARAAGVELAPPLYTDALGEPGSAGDTYAKMIRYNVATIVQALGK